jgi:hypothetical protein
MLAIGTAHRIIGVDLLASRPDIEPARIYGFGVGAGAVVPLQAVVDDRIRDWRSARC